MTVETAVRPEGRCWLVTRKGAEWRFWSRREADTFAQHLATLPDEASPTGWPWGSDLLYAREDRIV